MTEGDHCYVSGDEEDQPSPTQLWVWKDVELGRRINEVSDQVRRALIEMTDGEHAYVSDEEAGESHTLGLSWTPSRGSSIRETHRTNDQETEISEYMELQTTIRDTKGDALEAEGRRQVEAAAEHEFEQRRQFEEEERRILDAAAKAEAVERAEAQQKQEVEIQRQQEARLGD
ncbi:hypothetical protein V2G26_011173 [Clonostachys chloroleuca]